jgi:hypothetical protein
VNAETIQRAVLLAEEEFIQRAAVVRATEEEIAPLLYLLPCGKATGALRRTSMELTRALADLRRPG